MTLAEATSRVHARLLAEGRGAELPVRVAALVSEEAPLLGPALRAAVVDEVIAQVAGLGALEPLLADDS
ncbi:MAG TPA: hypothetical protein VF711_10650, partial [Acidimicrobiales bacterium]